MSQRSNKARGRRKSVPARVPEHVAILGLGPSIREFFELIKQLGGKNGYCDEIWGINNLGNVFACDRVFHMDDVKIQELRAAAGHLPVANMLGWLKTHPGPIYTSVVRDGYPGMVAFPLQDVLNGTGEGNGGSPYFNSTTAYAIAFAIHIGVKKISLFGVDYTMPNVHHAERGRACCEFWLGIAASRGIEIMIPQSSSLMDACSGHEARLYGYDCVDVLMRDRAEGGVQLRFRPKKTIPTAEEIEKRYDHSKHPNPLMNGGPKT